ncbi:MAG: hypothetical protein M1392_03070 [Gammaproteobacteria bacterium]|nr:hypothetical protein [Gammaproteobacteria bacterium]
MDTQHIEDLIKEALEEKQVEFEISEQRGALVLPVPNNSELVGLLDQVFNLGMASLIPLDRRGKLEPTPLFRIDRYTISPTPREKRTANGRYLYDFIYTPRSG